MKRTTAPAPAADWRKYAAAGAATLAAAAHADAAIIYVDPTTAPTVVAPTGAGSAKANFNIDGIALQLNAFHGNSGKQAVSVFGPLDFFVGGTLHKNSYMAAYAPGARIGARGQLTSYVTIREHTQHGAPFGVFQTGQAIFAGFRLPASKGGGDGWVRFEVTDPNHTGGPSGLEAIDWAYNDAGGGITAGQGIPSAVPEPGTDKALALLALGSTGVLAWRKRRAQAAA